jgi:hypothetical protein
MFQLKQLLENQFNFNPGERKECKEHTAAKMDKLLRLCGLRASSVHRVILLDFSYTEKSLPNHYRLTLLNERKNHPEPVIQYRSAYY